VGGRIAHRSARVLEAIASRPGACNREIAGIAGITDEGQMSKLLARFERLGLARREERIPGLPNAWRLTLAGARLERAIVNDPGLVDPPLARRRRVARNGRAARNGRRATGGAPARDAGTAPRTSGDRRGW
jgi:DNA-binding IclR family transcriptional regulator